jgi:hypothetical protein
MKTLILHDESGEIIAISNFADLQTSGSKFTEVGMIPAEGQRVLDVDLTGEDEKRSLLELHELYRVNTSAKRLVKR